MIAFAIFSRPSEPPVFRLYSSTMSCVDCNRVARAGDDTSVSPRSMLLSNNVIPTRFRERLRT